MVSEEPNSCMLDVSCVVYNMTGQQNGGREQIWKGWRDGNRSWCIRMANRLWIHCLGQRRWREKVSGQRPSPLLLVDLVMTPLQLKLMFDVTGTLGSKQETPRFKGKRSRALAGSPKYTQPLWFTPRASCQCLPRLTRPRKPRRRGQTGSQACHLCCKAGASSRLVSSLNWMLFSLIL